MVKAQGELAENPMGKVGYQVKRSCSTMPSSEGPTVSTNLDPFPKAGRVTRRHPGSRRLRGISLAVLRPRARLDGGLAGPAPNGASKSRQKRESTRCKTGADREGSMPMHPPRGGSLWKRLLHTQRGPGCPAVLPPDEAWAWAQSPFSSANTSRMGIMWEKEKPCF
jgi:hypothetical protein